MGKYYLENILEKETELVKSLTEYESRNAAEIAFHQEISYPTLLDDTLFVRCTVINSQGGAETGLSEYYKKEVPQPEPNSEDPEPTPITDTTKYYLTKIKYKTDNSEPVKELFDYDSKQEGIYAFHNGLHDDMLDAQYKALTYRLTDKYGNSAHDPRYWERS